MKITTLEDYTLQLEEVYNVITLKSDAEETFAICMRDSGFEFVYDGKWYEAKGGVIKERTTVDPFQI